MRTFSNYLEAFYRGYSRRTAKSHDHVQHRYQGGLNALQITSWLYHGKVIALAIRKTDGLRYLLLRQGTAKPSKAILHRLDSILDRYDLGLSPWREGKNSLIVYLSPPSHDATASITNRIQEIWNS